MSGLQQVSVTRKFVRGMVVSAFALTVLVGMHPGHAGAQKSMSTTCTTLEAGFNAADRQMEAAHRKGDDAGAAFWGNVSYGLQRAYLGMNCSLSEYEGMAT